MERLAREISRDYQGLNPLIIGVLTGSFIFVADLVRAIDIPVTLDFIDASSCRAASSTGEVSVERKPSAVVKDRHVVLVEDIVDTGSTAAHIMDLIRLGSPASLSLCTLLNKPWRRTTEVPIAYVGFKVPDNFVVGYGLDLNESFRNLPDLYTVDES